MTHDITSHKKTQSKRSETKLSKAKKVAEKGTTNSVKTSTITRVGKKSKERARKSSKSVTVQKVIICILFSYELNNNEFPACFFYST